MTFKFDKIISIKNIQEDSKEKVRNGFKKVFEYSKDLIRKDLDREARKSLNIKSRNFKNIFRFKLYDKDKEKDHVGITISVNSNYFGIFEDSNKTIKPLKSKMLLIPLLNNKYKNVTNSKQEFMNRINIAKSMNLTFTKNVNDEIFLFIKSNSKINSLFRNYRTNFKKKVLNGENFGKNDVFPVAILRKQITIKKHFAFTKVANDSFHKNIRDSINKFINDK